MESAGENERGRLIRRFARLEAEFETKGGYRAETEARKFAASVGITNAEMAQPVREMSGGQRRRAELSRILFAETDVLLLDEPTNYLDLDAKGLDLFARTHLAPLGYQAEQSAVGRRPLSPGSNSDLTGDSSAPTTNQTSSPALLGLQPVSRSVLEAGYTTRS